MAHTPRSERDVQRMRRTAETADGERMPAMAAALAQIGAAFDEAATINAFKMRVDRLIRLGPDHPVGARPILAPALPCCQDEILRARPSS